ncbi:EB1 homolog, putative [Plasmodium sp. gorilla clade G3]|nr:EB1 homolog, putative [Plasmodium sp. gorilla clade G3]
MTEYKDLQTAGKMDSSYFVSRKELIEWVNRYLKLNITKVEQCSNGAIYIQLLDILFPNKSVLHKAKWNAKMEYECIVNYKLIQSVFNKLGIKKYMDVDKLIKGKYQDNFEFLQWFKSFFERIVDYNNEQVINYDPIERRKLCLLGERGDYKQLNNYLPEWAKTDINVLKEKIYIYSDNNIGTILHKNKNLDYRDSVSQEISTGCAKGISRGMNNSIVNNNINNNVNNSTNVNINNSLSNKVNNYINSNMYSGMTTSTTTSITTTSSNNNNNNNNKIVKSEKGTMYINLNNDHNNNNNNNINSNNNTSLLSSYNDINIHKNKNTSNHNNNNNNINKRLSLSNKNFSQGSLSYYHNKSKILECQKDYNSLMDQNKKLKTQLENKNQELLLIQNKLKEEENEKKILHFQKNFYYNKLRFLELLCNQTDDSYILIHDIQQIIYARDNTYFHQTVSLNDKNITEDNESIEPNNTNELSLQHSIPHNESLTYNTQGSIDYATYCS